MTATLGVDLAPGATPDEVEAAMDLTSLSADEPIGLLSNDADKFFGRTTKVRLLRANSASIAKQFVARLLGVPCRPWTSRRRLMLRLQSPRTDPLTPGMAQR